MAALEFGVIDPNLPHWAPAVGGLKMCGQGEFLAGALRQG